MLIGRSNPSAQKTAWANYRGRLRETLLLLNENLEDAGDAGAREHIKRLIQRHSGYLQRAEKRIAELSN